MDNNKKILITYTYYKSPSADYNLKFFHDFGISYQKNIDFILVINGYDCSIKLKELPNLFIIKRQNLGYDFGGHSAALNYIESNNKKYDYYFFMNSGVIGPILPHYLEENNFKHWTEYFIPKINDKVKLVGTTIVCMKEKDLKLYGPRVEGFFFLTDQIGLNLLKEDGNIFKNHQTKFGAVINGEYGLGRCILKNGYNMDCMLNLYQNINWRDKENWHKNEYKHPSRHNSFYGKSINPYEVIFHKWYWHDEKNLVNFDLIDDYVNKKYNKKLDIFNNNKNNIDINEKKNIIPLIDYEILDEKYKEEYENDKEKYKIDWDELYKNNGKKENSVYKKINKNKNNKIKNNNKKRLFNDLDLDLDLDLSLEKKEQNKKKMNRRKQNIKKRLFNKKNFNRKKHKNNNNNKLKKIENIFSVYTN